MNLLKSEIRELIRPLRRFITPLYRQKASLAAATHFINSPFFQKSERLACYMAVADEIDSQPIIQALWEAQKICYLPVVTASPTPQLHFSRYDKDSKLILNRYHILEPQASTEQRGGSELDVVLLPVVAFDEAGNRLGTGGGYYDRTFSFMLNPALTKKNRPHLIGLAYELQKVERIPREAFDVPLEGVITEEGIRIF